MSLLRLHVRHCHTGNCPTSPFHFHPLNICLNFKADKQKSWRTTYHIIDVTKLRASNVSLPTNSIGGVHRKTVKWKVFIYFLGLLQGCWGQLQFSCFLKGQHDKLACQEPNPIAGRHQSQTFGPGLWRWRTWDTKSRLPTGRLLGFVSPFDQVWSSIMSRPWPILFRPFSFRKAISCFWFWTTQTTALDCGNILFPSWNLASCQSLDCL